MQKQLLLLSSKIVELVGFIAYSSTIEHPSPIYAEQSILSNYVESLCIDIVISTLRIEVLCPSWNGMLILPRYGVLNGIGISNLTDESRVLNAMQARPRAGISYSSILQRERDCREEIVTSLSGEQRIYLLINIIPQIHQHLLYLWVDF